VTWFGRAVQLGNHNYQWFCQDRNYDRLRGNAEYESILAVARRGWERYRQEFS
jgi:hypothetical protein